MATYLKAPVFVSAEITDKILSEKVEEVPMQCLSRGTYDELLALAQA